MPSASCRMGMHKWSNCGDRVLICWAEPGFVPGTKKEIQREVFCERECLRCGIKERRKFSENIDGTKAADGWIRIAESKTSPS